MNNLNKSLAVFNWASQRAEKDLVHTATKEKLQDSFEILDEIGRGAFGIVKKCERKTDKAMFAIKIILYKDATLLKDIEREVAIMENLEHEHLVTLYGAYECVGSFALVMDYIAGGELFQRIIEKEYLEEKEAVEYLRQLIEGLEYMHSKNIVHLDIKPENILCIDSTSNRIKLIDFGLARKLIPGEITRCTLGTPDFVAPEAILFNEIKHQTDMWSTGVLTYVLLSGLMPFGGDTDSETLCNISNVDWEFDVDSFEEISLDAQDFIKRLLILYPEKRLSSSDALKHPWMKNDNEQRAGKINTKRHRTFLARRRWKKSVHVIMAVTKLCRLLQFSSSGKSGVGGLTHLNKEGSSSLGEVKTSVENDTYAETAPKVMFKEINLEGVLDGSTQLKKDENKLCNENSDATSCGTVKLPILKQANNSSNKRSVTEQENQLVSNVSFSSSSGNGKEIMWKVLK